MALRNLQSLEKTVACAALDPSSIGTVPCAWCVVEKVITSTVPFQRDCRNTNLRNLSFFFLRLCKGIETLSFFLGIGKNTINNSQKQHIAVKY